MIDNKIFSGDNKETTTVLLDNSQNKWVGRYIYLDTEGNWVKGSVSDYSSKTITIPIPGYFEISETFSLNPGHTINGDYYDNQFSIGRRQGHLITKTQNPGA